MPERFKVVCIPCKCSALLFCTSVKDENTVNISMDSGVEKTVNSNTVNDS